MTRVSRFLSGLAVASVALLTFAPAHAQKPDTTKMKTVPGTSAPKGTSTAPKTGTATKMTGKMTTKKTPPRDPKTGRFISTKAAGTTGTMKATTVTKPVTTKKTPPRDPKTGRFISTKPAGTTGTAPSGSKMTGAASGSKMTGTAPKKP